MIRDPGNANDRFADYAVGSIEGFTLDEFFDALQDSGVEVERGLLTENGFLVQAND